MQTSVCLAPHILLASPYHSALHHSSHHQRHHLHHPPTCRHFLYCNLLLPHPHLRPLDRHLPRPPTSQS